MEYKEDIRIQKTKRDLRNAISRLLLTKPIEKISVTEICETAMVNRITFYKYYEDKYQLLDDTFFEIKNTLISSAGPREIRTLDEAREACADLLSVALKLVTENLDFISALAKNGNTEMMNIITKVMESGFNDLFTTLDKIRPIRYSIPFMSAFVTGGFIESLGYWIMHPSIKNEEMVKQMIADIKTKTLSVDFLFKA